jgi:hypothetical protein
MTLRRWLGFPAGSQPRSKERQGDNNQYPNQEQIKKFQGDSDNKALYVEDLYEGIIQQKKEENSSQDQPLFGL